MLLRAKQHADKAWVMEKEASRAVKNEIFRDSCRQNKNVIKLPMSSRGRLSGSLCQQKQRLQCQ